MATLECPVVHQLVTEVHYLTGERGGGGWEREGGRKGVGGKRSGRGRGVKILMEKRNGLSY